MKMLKKTLCVFLSVLMFMTGISASFVAFATESKIDEAYRSLAYSFFSYRIESSEFDSSNVINTDSKGFPIRSMVGDLDHYSVSNASDDYKYADDQDVPIRAISYSHRVDAKDNSQGLIRSAAQTYLSIVDEIMSTTYGVGLYTIPMVADKVSETLKFTKGDDGKYLFLDGYTYLVNAVGDIQDRSPAPTYEVLDGEIYELETDDSWLEPYAETIDQYVIMNLYELCHVSTIIDFFSGNCTSINSGNWFHSFTFHCATDVETVLTTEDFDAAPFAMNTLTVEWKLNRQFDDSGTVAQYYNDGYKLDTGTETQNNIRIELAELNTFLNQYFATYLTKDANGRMLLDMLRNQDLVNFHYDEIMKHYDAFASISNKAKIAVFGQTAYSYINLVTQLTPIVNPSSPEESNRFWPKHTYTKYKDSQGNNIVYQVDAQKVTTIVSTIDGLLKSERVGTILRQFIDFTGPEYEDMAYYNDAVNAKTPQDILKVFIADFVYQDSIINMLLELLYPMVCDLLDGLLTDQFMQETLSGLVSGIDLSRIVDGVVNQGDGWLSTIYGVLASIGVTLTPAGLAYVWNRYGYLKPEYGYTTTFPEFRNMHDHLKAAKGGITKSGLHSTDDYEAIGSEKSASSNGVNYYGDRWRDVDFSKMVWGINGDQQKFLMALDAILLPVAPLLAVLFGDADSTLRVADVLGSELDLQLNNKDITHNYYNTILLPVFEVLGIPGLITGEQFEINASHINKDANRNPDSVATFLNQGILSPLLGWVNNVLLADPIGTVLNLLPNLSYFLTSGGVFGALSTLKVPITITHLIALKIPITVYTLDIMDLIGEDTLAFLDSLQGILSLIAFKVDTGIPIIGYHAKNEIRVYRPDTPGYNPSYHTIPVMEAFASDIGELSLQRDDFEFTTLVTGLDENGNFNQYAIYNDVGWANGSGYVVTEHSDTATPEEYSIPVKEFYEYSVVNIVTNEAGEEVEETITYRVRSLDMVPAELRESGDYGHSYSVVTKEEPAELPPIMDYKLQAVGEVTTVDSGRYGVFTMTGRDGVTQNWATHKRNYINVEVKGMQTEGLVLLFLFRYLFSGIMYRPYDGTAFVSDYTVLDAFGLDSEMLTDDLFAGLRIQDILDNVVLNPDGAIAALYELFYKNEFGSLYKVLNGEVLDGDEYSYAPKPVDYHTDEIFGYADEYNDYTYGTSALYSEYWTRDKAEYMVDNLDDIADNVFAMLKLENMGSLTEFLEGFVGDLLFTNDMLSTIASALYGLLANLGGDSIDLPGILDAALDVDMAKQTLADALVYEFGDLAAQNGTIETETGEVKELTSIYNKLVAENAITEQHRLDAELAKAAKDIEAYEQYKALEKESAKYSDNTFYYIGVDQETGEESKLYSYDWGYGNEEIRKTYSDPEIFLRALSAIASPFAILFKFLFAGEDLSILNLITLPGYEGYYYAWIPLMETLGGDEGLVDFKTYFSKIFNGESALAQNCDTIYYTVKPLIAFVEKTLANPVEVVFNLLPDLLFFISIGGLNGMVNNLIHFVYVLLDILGPVFDAYPLANSLLGNLNIGGMQLSLSVPLDFDFNQLVNQLLEGLLGETLSFDIENKNIVLGTQEVERKVFIPTLDENGEEMFDEEGNAIGIFEKQTFTEEVYAVGNLSIKLPYIDFSTLCAGTITKKLSVSGRNIVSLDTAGGADLLTLIFRIVTDTLFYEENAINLANFLIGFCRLDDENDSDELLMEIFVYLNGEAKKTNIPDVIIGLIYTIYQVLVPLAGALGERFKNVDFSITELFEDINDMEITKDRISQLLDTGESNPTLSGFARLIELLKQFFDKLAAFFAGLFGG